MPSKYPQPSCGWTAQTSSKPSLMAPANTVVQKQEQSKKAKCENNVEFGTKMPREGWVWPTEDVSNLSNRIQVAGFAK